MLGFMETLSAPEYEDGGGESTTGLLRPEVPDSRLAASQGMNIDT